MYMHNSGQSIQGRRCVYLMLGVVVCFGMVYFSYRAFHDYSYGFGDMYRHHSWIYGLLNGTPFYEESTRKPCTALSTPCACCSG